MVVPDYAYEYQAGGSLAASAPSYVQRSADACLYRALRTGEFAYVFNCRQMGKSSLRVQTEQHLRADGVRTATLDLSSLGADDATAAEWYRTLIDKLNRSLTVMSPQELDDWLAKQVEVTPLYRLHRFIEDMLLTRIAQAPIAIFIDEIDSVLSLSFPVSDFFALIRACYNARAENASYRRLTFALLGVTTPSQLIRDTERTPFNIGQAIALGGLELNQAQPLVDGLVGWVAEPDQVLTEIFKWTGGQPYLTQKLCALVQERAMEAEELPLIAPGEAAETIARVVNQRLIENWESGDEQAHFKTIRDRILRREQLSNRMLAVYEQVLAEGAVPVDNSDTQMELRLTGVVVARHGNLEVFNPIYRRIFDETWVRQTLENLRPYAESFRVWVASDYEDEGHLLQGSVLAKAQIWAKGKSLSALDDRYLRESQELENREVRQKLEQTEALSQEIEERRQTLEALNQVAEEQIHTQNRKIRVRSLLATVMLIASAVGGATAFGIYSQLGSARGELSDLELTLSFRESALQQSQQEAQNAAAQLDVLKVESRKAIEEAEQLQQSASVARREQQQAEQQRDRAIREANEAQGVAATAQKQANRAIAEVNAANSERQIALEETSFAQKIARLERAGQAAIEKFQMQEIDALWDAFRAAISAHEIYRKKGLTFLAHSPILALQSNLEKIREINVLPGYNENRLVDLSSANYFATIDKQGIAHLWDFQGNFVSFLKGKTGVIKQLKFHPDGSLIATGHEDGSVIIWNLQGDEIAILQGHSGPITQIQFSPNGTLIATSGEDGLARIWNLQGNEIAILQGHSGPITQIQFSPNGTLIVTSGEDGLARIWDLQGNEITLLDGHIESARLGGGIIETKFSPCGDMILTRGTDQTARLWSIQGAEMTSMGGHQGYVEYMQFDQNSEFIVTISEGTSHLWNLKGDQVATMEGSSLIGGFGISEFSPDGQYIVTNGNGAAHLWDLEGNEVATLDGHQGWVKHVHFSPDGSYIATTDDGGTIRLWDLEGNEVITLNGHQRSINKILFNFNDSYIVTSGEDGTVRLWNFQNSALKTIVSDQAAIYKAYFNDDGNSIAVLGEDGSAVWDLMGNQILFLQRQDYEIPSITFSRDGNYFAAIASDHTVGLWTSSGHEVAALEAYEVKADFVQFSPDTRHIATGHSDGTVFIWDFQGNRTGIIQGNQNRIYRMGFSPDGKFLAISSSDGTVRLWDIKGNEIANMVSQNSHVELLKFSPDGKILATTSSDGTARLWNLKGNEIANMVGHKNRIYRIKFSPDGKILATTSSDGTARLWNLKGNEIANMNNHHGWVNDVEFSPDGKHIVTGGEDHTARLWDLQGNEIAVLEGHQSSVSQVLFSPDSKNIATFGVKDSSRIWTLTGQQVAQYQGRGFLRDDWSVIAILEEELLTGKDVIRLRPVYTPDRLGDLLADACKHLIPYLTYNPDITDEERAMCDIPPLPITSSASSTLQ